MMGTGVILPWQGLKSTERALSEQQATQLQVRLTINDEEWHGDMGAHTEGQAGCVCGADILRPSINLVN